MIVSSPDNFRKTREHGFTIQGLKSRHRRRVETMRVGDRMLYYVTGRMAFAASVTTLHAGSLAEPGPTPTQS